MAIERVGDFTLGWGESLLWDDRRDRLYFVDCAAQTLHWLDGDELGPGRVATQHLHTVSLPSMAAGIVPTDRDGLLVGALDDGLHVIDPDLGTTELLSPYPDELGGRCNDVCADLDGNIITGKLNLGPAVGAAWRWSPTDGWRLLDPDIANTNGPQVAVIDGTMTLIVGDTSADYYRYDYDPATGAVGPRSVFGDTQPLDGHPDGTTLDAAGGLWCALYGGRQLVRFTSAGFDRALPIPVDDPTDVTFGGPELDRLYIVAVNGGLLVVDDIPVSGRAEPRAHLV